MSTNATSGFDSPTNPPGPMGAGDLVQSGTSSVSGSETTVYTDWRRIVFVLLWLLAFSMLLAVMFSCTRAMWRSSVSNKHGSSTQNDEENQEEDKGNTEPRDQRQPSTSSGRSPARILSILAMAIALSLSIAAQTSCEYISADDIHIVRISDNQEVQVETFGLWSAAIYDGTYGSNDQCQTIFRNGFPVDGKMIFSRVVAVLASTLGVIALILAVYLACSSRLGSAAFRRLAWPLSAAALMQALVFVLLATDLCYTESACILDIGGVSSATAVLYYFIAALGIVTPAM